MDISSVPALILAGGLGTRLQTVVNDIPKPMAPIGGTPFLEYQIRYLRRRGVTRIVLLIGYKGDIIQNHFGDGSRFDVHIGYCREHEPLGTAGALKNAGQIIDQDIFLLLNGDTFFPCDVACLIDRLAQTGCEASIALKLHRETARYGSVIIDDTGMVTGFMEKAASLDDGYVNGGVYALSRSILTRITAGVKTSLEAQLFPVISACGVPFSDKFIDIGIPEDYARAVTAIPQWENGTKHKAVFLDRDGVINEDRGYPYKPEHISFKDGIFEACRALATRGFRLFVVTNQSGVARGRFGADDVTALHAWMTEEFKRRGIDICEFAFCPFLAKGTVPEYARPSLYRKPQPGMILELADKWDIDLKRSFMVGDKLSDRIRLPYLRSIVIKSQYAPTGYDVESIDDASKIILA